MEAAHHESGLADQAPPKSQPLYAVQGVESRLQRELAEQLDSVVAFADLCTCLTSDRLSDTAERLRELALSLHAETTEDLRRSRPRG